MLINGETIAHRWIPDAVCERPPRTWRRRASQLSNCPLARRPTATHSPWRAACPPYEPVTRHLHRASHNWHLPPMQVGHATLPLRSSAFERHTGQHA